MSPREKLCREIEMELELLLTSAPKCIRDEANRLDRLGVGGFFATSEMIEFRRTILSKMAECRARISATLLNLIKMD